jgi:DNA invertase Pin-like site-specific DNA recombinase
VEDYLNGGNWELVAAVTETESGKNSDRPELARALNLCRLYRATLIVAKLDRLSRNVHFLSGLMESGVDFVCVDMPSANRLTIHILVAVAEDEADRISQRTKAALQAAKARGKVLSGHRAGALPAEAVARGRQRSLAVRRQNAACHNATVLPLIEELKGKGLRATKVAEELNARRIRTAGGTEWDRHKVWRVLNQAACQAEVRRWA